ncbi:Crp/Fnr family transcriptional regulator, partial [Microbispora bryophytorum]
TVIAWRGVPILPCDKIPISEGGLSSILVMRTGADKQGVVGLRRTGLPDAWWRTLPLHRVLAVLDAEALGDLLTELAVDHWPAAAVMASRAGVRE